MALAAKIIKGKIASVKNVGKITKAMELVSVSKMKRSTDAVVKTREYAQRAINLLTSLESFPDPSDALFKNGSNDRNLIVIIASNKGLCGSYNVNIDKSVRRFVARIRTKHTSEIDAVCVGKRAEKIARMNNLTSIASFVEFGDEINSEESHSLATFLHKEFQTGKYYNIVIVYTEYESALSNHVEIRQLYPIKQENVINMMQESWRDMKETLPSSDERFDGYRVEPSVEEVKRSILLRLVHVQLYQSLLEASASEHSSRMFSMKNATDNSKKFADELTLSYNQARQAGITRELSEIASGSDALSG